MIEIKTNKRDLKKARILFHISNSFLISIMASGLWIMISTNEYEQSIRMLVALLMFFPIWLITLFDYYFSLVIVNDNFIYKKCLFMKRINIQDINKIKTGNGFIIVFDKLKSIKVDKQYGKFNEISAFILQQVSNNKNIEIINM